MKHKRKKFNAKSVKFFKKFFLKSQITVLIVVGLALLIAAASLLYLSSSTMKKESQQSVKANQETALEIQPIREFVQKCVDKLAKDAVILMGNQGGYIYKSQGGTLIDYDSADEGKFFVRHNGLNAAYNIIPLRFPISHYSAETPDAPWATFPYETKESAKEIFNGIFGIKIMPPLEFSQGPHSIQSQIETFIDNHIAECADFTLFRNAGYEIEMNKSRTQAVIARRNVIITSLIPLKITNTAEKETAELREFSTNLELRLRDMYSFTAGLIENDVKNINFDISDIKNSKDSMNVRLIKSAFSNDDLVIVTDENSLIRGKPFEYIFARKNRAPALFFIKDNDLKFPRDYKISRKDLVQEPEPSALDPDEDDIAFNIFKGEFSASPLPPDFSIPLNIEQIKFRVEASDGKLSDWQIINATIK